VSSEDLSLGPVQVLRGERGGKYPQGNSLLIRGNRETVVVDPSLGLIARRDRLPGVDRVLNSHCHEDHVAGNHLFPAVPWHAHELDVVGFRSLDDMMAIYGYDASSPAVAAAFRESLVDDFHWVARPDARAFRDGDGFDLGGVRLRVLHTPGHTRGHSCFLVDWDGSTDRLVYLGDIDLTSFGPYYGDAWSDLEDFERSLERVRALDVRWYATFHHIGVLEGRAAFLERLDRFTAKIAEREQRLLEFLADPRSLDEIARHRFVYRPEDPVSFAEPVERRSMAQHLERLIARGAVEVLPGDRFRRVVA
jgi:glyoxylase-like metal-dependent hydrolase (beta-lactamase superfamily II)